MRFLRAIGAIALVFVALPFSFVAGLGFTGRTCTPDELASELNELARGDMSGWDRLECVRLKDHRLEAVRQEAIAVDLPLRDGDRVLLRRLAAKAVALNLSN